MSDPTAHFAKAVPGVFQEVSKRARSKGLVVWADNVDAAAQEWQTLREAHPDCHPVHLAIDATLVCRASGPDAVLMEQWITTAHRADLDGFYGLPSAVGPAALTLPLMPFAAATRMLALDVLRQKSAEDEPNRHVAASYMVLVGEWPTVLVGADRARAHVVLDDFRELLAQTEVSEVVRDRYAQIQKLIPPAKKRPLGLTPEQIEWARNAARKVGPQAVVAVARLGMADIAGLGALVKMAAEVMADIGKITGDEWQ